MRRRRLALTGAALAAIVIVAVIAVALLRSGDSSGPSASGTDWNAVAVLDRDAGEVVIVDDEGAELDRFDAGVGEPAAFAGSRGGYVIVHEVSGEAPEWAILDTRSGEVVWKRAHERFHTAWLPGTTSPVAMSYDPAGSEEAFVIDAGLGAEVDVLDAAGFADPWIGPGSGRASPDGRVAVVVDNASDGLATAVIDTEELDAAESEVLTVTGRFIGFGGPGDDVLGFIGATEEGDDRLVLIDPAGDEVGSMVVPDMVGGAFVDRQTAVVSTADGELLHVATSADEPSELVDLDADGPAAVQSVPGAGRLVVTTGTGMRLLTVDGDELAAIGGTRLFTSMNDRTACLHVADDDDVAHLVDVETGDDLATTEHLDPVDVRSSDDGCTVTYRTGDGFVVLARSGVVEHDGGEVVDVAPDGSALMILDEGAVRLMDLDDPGAAPLDVGAERTAAAFLAR